LAIRIPLLADLDLRINQPNSKEFGEDHEGSVKLSVILRQAFQFDRNSFGLTSGWRCGVRSRWYYRRS